MDTGLAFQARVLLGEHEKEKLLFGALQIECKPVDESLCSLPKLNLSQGIWSLRALNGELLIENQNEKSVQKMKGSLFAMKGSFTLDGQKLERVDLQVQQGKSNWILYLPVDQYLYGVLAAEVPASWPLEALKAQAIASRTYFLFKKQERQHELFDVHSNTMDQVFKMDAKKHRKILKAVDSTHNQILLSRKEGAIFPAYFHADCGGGPSQEDVVWREPTALNVEVKDPFCQSASKNNWSLFVDRVKLTNLLKKTFLLPLGVHLKSILPRLGEQSRAHVVDFLFSDNTVKRIEANEFRRLLGFSSLRSTHFEVKDHKSVIEFEGRGYGHGVGLCQWGAQRWARKGKSYRQILKHYYPKAQLKSLDSQIMSAFNPEVF